MIDKIILKDANSNTVFDGSLEDLFTSAADLAAAYASGQPITDFCAAIKERSPKVKAETKVLDDEEADNDPSLAGEDKG